MSLRASASNLQEAIKDLSARWENCRSDWTDAKSIEFSARFLEKLPEQIRNSVNLIEELDAILRRVRSDCE